MSIKSNEILDIWQNYKRRDQTNSHRLLFSQSASSYILDIWQGSEYASDCYYKVHTWDRNEKMFKKLGFSFSKKTWLYGGESSPVYKMEIKIKWN